MMQEVIWIDNKAYRKGYTTGSCATAAAKAAAQMILSQEKIDQVRIITPSNVILDLDVLESNVADNVAIAAIQKDGGDDIDVTHGMLIYAKVSLNQTGRIHIEGGVGIGRVTRKGVRHAIGEAAINETPKKTIESAVREVIGEDHGADVLIYAPGGAEIAQETYNPRLGIVDGISILGTTGIVTPMSDESWKKSISLELEVKREEGLNKIIFVPGNHGERFAEGLGLNPNHVVVISNFVRHALKEIERLGYKEILLLGHFGKLVKVAAGVFNTHSHVADARMETMITHLALMSAPIALIEDVYNSSTTEEAMEFISKAGYQEVYDAIAKKIKSRIEHLSKYGKNPLSAESILFSMEGNVLGVSQSIEAIIERFQS